MRSWNYYIQVKGINREKEEENSALYIVALPPDESLLKLVEMECYAQNYIPMDIAIKYGKAYAIGTDIKLENLQDYKLAQYREDMDLYIFEEGVSFEEGLTNLYKLLIDDLSKKIQFEYVYPVVDVGSPPEEVMINCLKKVL